MEKFVIFNVTEEPEETEHICWYVEKRGDFPYTYSLHEIVKEKYKHPEAPEYAFVFRYESYIRITYKGNEEKSEPLKLLYSIQKSTTLLKDKLV